MDITRVYFSAPSDTSEEQIKNSPEVIRLEKRGIPRYLFSTSKWTKSMGTVWSEPLIPKHQIDDKFDLGGQNVTVKGIEPVQYKSTWDIEYSIQYPSGETLKIMQPNLP
jgi:hypothetical protein